MSKISNCILAVLSVFWLGSCTSHQISGIDCDNTINNWEHFIPKDSVQVMVSRLAAFKKENNIDTSMIAQSYLFGSAKEMIRNMMLRDSCTGIRVYYGLNASNHIIPIVCGVNKTGGDIYWKKGNSMPGNTGDEDDGLCDVSTEEPPPLTSGPYIYP